MVQRMWTGVIVVIVVLVGLRSAPAADAAKPGNGDRNRRRSHPVSSSTGGVIQEASIPVGERGGNVLVAF